MIRNAILCFCFCLTLALPALAQERFAERLAGSPTLKAEAMVSSEIVRIGDLVENAGAVAEVPIFRAPDLGQSGAVRASRVADAVRPHHIVGLDTHGLTEIMVTRASRAITARDFEMRIVRALAGQYGLADAKNLSVIFDNQPRTVQVEPTSAELRVARITFEPRNGRFDALLELPGSAARRAIALHRLIDGDLRNPGADAPACARRGAQNLRPNARAPTKVRIQCRHGH